MDKPPAKTHPALSHEDLSVYFHDGIKKPEDFKIGVEWEKIGVYRESGKAITYSGARGVKAIFDKLIADFAWQPVQSGEHVIALEKPHGSITLEPGGQIELSGQAASNLEDNAREIYRHLNEISTISGPMGVAWLGLGAQPLSVAEEMEWVPKKRYDIMRTLLKERGAMTYRMMKETASIQVSLDFDSEADAILKLKLAMGLSPFLTAIFANSPLLQGKSSGSLSRRALIWENTAPERTGILWDELDPKRGFRSYLDYALKVPMMFIQRDGEWLYPGEITFETFLNKGFGGYRATLDDWELHLTGIFTEARLKKYVEIRSIDCQKTGLGLAAAALIKGLFYSKESLTKSLEALGAFNGKDLMRLHHEAAHYGYNASVPGSLDMRAFAKLFYGLALKGLSFTEKQYLAPLEPLIERGITPAENILGCFDSNQTIFNCAAIEG